MYYRKIVVTALFLFMLLGAKQPTPDVTLVSYILRGDGLGQISVGFIDMLSKEININFRLSRSLQSISLKDTSASVQEVFKKSRTVSAPVALFVDMLWTKDEGDLTEHMPNALIKLAYSMLESSRIPVQWVTILNEKFDAVIVPDSTVGQAYKESGVTRPIFVVPCPVDFTNLLKMVPKDKIQSPFVFGISAGFWARKNHLLLINAFAKEWPNSNAIKLKVHGRFGDNKIIRQIASVVNRLNLSNIEFINHHLSYAEYIHFLKSLDCYVLPSQGEGFSITPREALALGVPCIVSNNTAHKVLCGADLVKILETPLKKSAYLDISKSFCGYYYSCSEMALRKALREVYNHYDHYLTKARNGRAWLKLHSYENLKAHYMAFIKPQQVNLGELNIVENNCLTTNCPELYKKYKQLQERSVCQ